MLTASFAYIGVILKTPDHSARPCSIRFVLTASIAYIGVILNTPDHSAGPCSIRFVLTDSIAYEGVILNTPDHTARPCRIRLLYRHLQRHNDTILKTHAGRLLYKNMYLSLYLQGSKRFTQLLRVRGSWRLNRNFNILTPTLMAVSVVSFLFSNAQPEAQRPTLLGDGFLYCILSATSLVPKFHRGSRRPLRPGLAFPTRSRPTPTGTQTVFSSVLTELYNSSTPTRSPTRYLKSHVWSSSNGNNCHAV